MAKPIFTIALPRGESQETIEDVQRTLSNSFDEYYVLIYIGNEENVIFNCFYEKDFNEVKYEELKEIVRNSIKLKEE